MKFKIDRKLVKNQSNKSIMIPKYLIKNSCLIIRFLYLIKIGKKYSKVFFIILVKKRYLLFVIVTLNKSNKKSFISYGFFKSYLFFFN